MDGGSSHVHRIDTSPERVDVFPYMRDPIGVISARRPCARLESVVVDDRGCGSGKQALNE